MAELKIRDVDEMVILLLDEIAAREKYSSRNQLLQEIVRLYVTSHHEFFSKSLPPTVQFLCVEAISEHQIYVEKALEVTNAVSLNLLSKMDKLYALFESELSSDSD